MSAEALVRGGLQQDRSDKVRIRRGYRRAA